MTKTVVPTFVEGVNEMFKTYDEGLVFQCMGCVRVIPVDDIPTTAIDVIFTTASPAPHPAVDIYKFIKGNSGTRFKVATNHYLAAIEAQLLLSNSEVEDAKVVYVEAPKSGPPSFQWSYFVKYCIRFIFGGAVSRTDIRSITALVAKLYQP